MSRHQQAIKSLFQVMALAGALLVVITMLMLLDSHGGAHDQNLNCNRNRADAGSGPGTANQPLSFWRGVIAMEASDASP